MFVLETIFEFSRQNCVAICAFLVPANLLVTLQTLILVGIQRPVWQIRSSVALASILAITMFLHVSTWFMIGIVTPVTFILFGLGTTCLTINLVSSIYRQKFAQLLQLSRKLFGLGY
jgi:hypothetical protein